MKEYFSRSPEQTESLGKSLAEWLISQKTIRAFIALYGEMGVGKTAFTRGFAAALGCKAVKSPTYTVVNEYRMGSHPIFHFDMYRIEDENDLMSIGFYDYLLKDGFALCEWSENIESEIPSDAITVKIERTEDELARKITIKGAEDLC